MTKAEERALEAYPNEHFVDHTYAEMCRGFYEEGYEQAEKDLALTWEDIKLVNRILWDLYSEGYDCDSEEQDETRFKEALKRFKEAKK